MADNITLSDQIGTSGAVLATDQIGGDAGPHYQLIKLTYGALESQTIASSGAGAVNAGVPRVTLASDDPGVALLGTIDTDTSVIAGDTTSLDGKIVVGAGTEAGAVRVTLATDSTGLVSVDDNGGSLTVDGTVTANPASGTIDTVTTVGTVTTVTNDVNIADGGNSITVDSGAAFTVQEDGAALTALQVIDNIVHVDNAAYTLTTDSGVMAMGFAGTQSVNANDAAALACETDGSLHIHDGGNTITVDGTVVVTATNLDCQSGGVDMATAAGQLVDGHNVTIDNAAGASAVNIQDGGNTITVDGTVAVTGVATAANQLPAISGGISTVYRDEDIDETAVALKAGAGQIYWIHVINLDATPVYLHFYDVAQGSVTVGTTGELCSFVVPTQGDANGAGFTMHFNHGIEFSTAITIACTTTIGGTAGPGTNEVICNVGFE